MLQAETAKFLRWSRRCNVSSGLGSIVVEAGSEI